MHKLIVKKTCEKLKVHQKSSHLIFLFENQTERPALGKPIYSPTGKGKSPLVKEGWEGFPNTFSIFLPFPSS
jgi:hypothetical protein